MNIVDYLYWNAHVQPVWVSIRGCPSVGVVAEVYRGYLFEMVSRKPSGCYWEYLLFEVVMEAR